MITWLVQYCLKPTKQADTSSTHTKGNTQLGERLQLNTDFFSVGSRSSAETAKTVHIRGDTVHLTDSFQTSFKPIAPRSGESPKRHARRSTLRQSLPDAAPVALIGRRCSLTPRTHYARGRAASRV